MIAPELLFLLIAVIAVIVFFVFIVLLVGGIILYAKGTAKENLKVWEELSEKLNLQMPDPEDFRLAGTYNDLEVEVKTYVKMVSMYGQTESYQFTNCTVKFPQSLNLSLKLKHPKESDSPSLLVGQTEFDSNFSATCSSQETLQKFLQSESVKNNNLLSDILQTKSYIETTSHNPALVKVKHEKTNPTFLITDDSVFIEFRTKFGNESEQVKQLLDVTTHLAKQIYTARLNLS